MSIVTDLTETLQDQVLDAVKTSYDITLSAVRTWAELTEPVTAVVRSLPGVNVLPEPAVVVEQTFGFAERLLAAQKAYAEQLAAAGTAQAAS